MSLKNAFLTLVLTLAAVWALGLAGCARNSGAIPALTGNGKPVAALGNDEAGRHPYRSIERFIVGPDGRIFLADTLSFDGVDVYDAKGDFLFKFGRKGQGPDELQALGCGAVDAGGNIWLDDGNRRTLKVFSPEGKFDRECILPKELTADYIKKLAVNKAGDLVILTASNEFRLTVFIFSPRDGSCRSIYTDARRDPPSALFRFMPDLALDGDGDIYITDGIDYRIHVFDKDGRELREFTGRGTKKEPLLEKDLDFFQGGTDKIAPIISDAGGMLGLLKGPDRFFPEIFGLNIDGGLIYVWTSTRDALNRYVVDIYDLKFNLKGRAAYFNTIRSNMAVIRNGLLYIPNVENYDKAVTDRLGRLFPTNMCDKLMVYDIR